MKYYWYEAKFFTAVFHLPSGSLLSTRDTCLSGHRLIPIKLYFRCHPVHYFTQNRSTLRIKGVKSEQGHTWDTSFSGHRLIPIKLYFRCHPVHYFTQNRSTLRIKGVKSEQGHTWDTSFSGHRLIPIKLYFRCHPVHYFTQNRSTLRIKGVKSEQDDTWDTSCLQIIPASGYRSIYPLAYGQSDMIPKYDRLV